MPTIPFVRTIDSAIDGYLGLSQLSPAQRLQAMAMQVRAAFQLGPIMAVGGVAAVGPLAYSTLGGVHVEAVVGLLVLYLVVQAHVLHGWWVLRQTEKRRDILVRKTASRLILSAATLGLISGCLIGEMVAHADLATLMMVVSILTAGMMMVCFVLAALAQAMLAFVVASAVMAATSLLMHPASSMTGPAISFIGLYLAVTPWVGLQIAKTHVRSIVGEVRQREIAEINRQLLDGYEETASEWFWEVDASGRTVRMSPRLCSTLGLPVGTSGVALLPLLAEVAAPGDAGIAAIESAFLDQRPIDAAEVSLKAGDEVRWWRVSGKPASIDAGGARGYIGTVSDITAEKATESKIIQLAHRDTLTGLFNRASFTERLEGAVRTLERYGTPFTLLFLDLDKFKLVNDTYGHPVGDKLLIEVSNRIEEAVRKQDCVARLGGDEFAIIIERSNDAVYAAKLASRLIAKVLEAYHIDGETLWIGVSVGIALAPQHGTRPEQILRNADLALYRAKEDGRGVFRYFEAQMDFAQRERRVLEQEMHQALEEEEFRLCYQPMISAANGHICCMEALIRWDHPIRGEISPVEFISIAEQSNLIVDIGKWTLLTACKAAMDWPEHVCVSVNVAATHFMRSDIVGDVEAVLEETGLSGERLEIEITESLLIEDSDDIIERLMALKRFGCSVVMDDFGTGYSSLSYLLKFPFDRLKIDRSFVADIGHGASAKAILTAIASLGDNLGIKITAEGVETREQLAFLQEIACDQLQGYYFSRPVRHEDVAPLMLRNFIDTATIIPIADSSGRVTRSAG